MAKGVNKVIIIGNLGKDPDARSMPNGTAVTNITVATSDVWKDRQSGQQQERTEWHKVVFFGRLAEVVDQYLKKGSKVYIEGSLRTRSYEKDGQKHYVTEIVASEMQMLDSRGSGGGDDLGFDEQHQGQAGGYERSASNGKQQQAAPRQAEHSADFEDDIPF